ncbi:MAG: hypothetical protein JSW02_05060 [candidate division WOR-3 bacterium]|nr:MAG: hypothetical protein JSW02_05060 [candidate division WOR-3 bacterium]
MKIVEWLKIAQQVIYLTCAMLFCFAAGTFGSGLVSLSVLTGSLSTTPGAGQVNPWQAFLPLLIFSFAVAVMFVYIIRRSCWHGLKLAFAIFIAIFGLMTVVIQLESLLFLNSRLPAGFMRSIFLMGFLTAALFAPFAVIITGRVKKAAPPPDKEHLVMPVGMWVWKLALIGLCYVVLYLAAGYFIAWQSPALRKYYGGYDPGTIIAHVGWLITTSPHIFPFQFFRGLVWMLCVLPIIKMHRGRGMEMGLTVAALFIVWNLQLFMPNPLMPAEVARIHFIEMSVSNSIFGFIVGILLA